MTDAPATTGPEVLTGEGAGLVSVTHFRTEDVGNQAVLAEALALLAERPGFLRGTVGRSTDDPADWLLVTEWRDVGSYRRGLGSYEVKRHLTPVLGTALDVPGSFEALVSVAAGSRVSRSSDRA
jgi:heme oxygenase (mycobilin-producing)